MRYRAFCVGYDPPSRTFSRATIDALIEQADVCVMAKRGIPVGSKFEGIDGKRMLCVAHEHHGKIAVLEDDTL